MKTAIILGMVLGIAGIAGATSAHEFKAGGITIEHPWARSTAASIPNGAVYLVLSNEGQQTDRLISASSPIAQKAEVHTHVADEGVMRMRPISAVEVMPGSPTALAPGGLHIMLLGLKEPLVRGKAFPLTLTFEKAGPVNMEVEVQGPGAMAPSHEEGEKSK
jgi:copper(I)-binding protein